MKLVYQFKGLYHQGRWLSPCYVKLDDEGMIEDISTSSVEMLDDEASFIEVIDGYALPGFQNAHSHAFQYGMAGHTEALPQGAGEDDFWSWRETMYELALSLSPEQMQAIATKLYKEMVRHGYTSVAEFHYLHHQPSGAPYEALATMGACLANAAHEAGLKLTLVPVLYQRGGWGVSATPRQRRFLCATLEEYLSLLTATQALSASYPLVSVGAGVHSLRAVSGDNVKALFAAIPASMPFHIHVSEQTKEVEDSLLATGKRPVEWLLEALPLDARCHLVHATHVLDHELEGIATSGAHVVLCPSTEGNLGDGIFPLRRYRELGGSWSIGTDSHVGLSPLEELRWLDYGQRLSLRKRNPLCLREGEDSAVIALEAVTSAGLAAMGDQRESFFARGAPFDAALFQAETPLLSVTPEDKRLSALLYSHDASHMLGTIVNGRWAHRR